MRRLSERCEKYGRQQWDRRTRSDLVWWLSVLDNASTRGVSINNITCIKPHFTIWTDASEWGIGGYDSLGTYWRYELPHDLRGIFSINLLEFIAAYFGIIISSQHHNIRYARILAFTDNSSALA